MSSQYTTLISYKDASESQILDAIDKGFNKKQVEAYLQSVADAFAKELGFEINLPITLNGRLSRVLGYYQHTGMLIGGDYTICREKITIQTNYAKACVYAGQEGLESLEDTIKHEVMHYYLRHQFPKRGAVEYQDGAPEFEGMLAKYGISSSNATNPQYQLSNKDMVIFNLVDTYKNDSTDALWHDKYHKTRNYTYQGLTYKGVSLVKKVIER